MRKFLLFTISFIILNCTGDRDNESLIISDKEWEDIILQTLVFSTSKENLIYDEYCNIELKSILEDIYTFCDKKFSYTISDSIINYIKTRHNTHIPNKIDTAHGIFYIEDTSSVKSGYFTYSEPFFVDSGKLCLAFSFNNKNEEIQNKWVCFFQDQQYLKLVGYFDLNEDKIYTIAQ